MVSISHDLIFREIKTSIFSNCLLMKTRSIYITANMTVDLLQYAEMKGNSRKLESVMDIILWCFGHKLSFTHPN